jgi:hypothetical protein
LWTSCIGGFVSPKSRKSSEIVVMLSLLLWHGSTFGGAIK